MKDIRRFLIILFIIVAMILSALAVIASAEAKARLSAKSSVLYSPDLSYFLEENNADVRLPMASTTKIMTALVVIENADMDKTVSVKREAVGVEGSSVYLKEGDRLSVRDLLYSLLLQSANDAAVALAMEVSGSIDEFAALMNEKAAEIGLCDTSFKNPHGLDEDGHYTTAHDLALIAAEAIRNEVFAKICSTYKYTFSLGDGTRTVINHNKLLRMYDGAVGIKTGYTKKSGRCLVSSAVRDGVTMIAVTLDAPDDWQDHKAMLDSGFARVNRISLSDLIGTSYTVNVVGGACESISAHAVAEDGIFTLDTEDVEYRINLPRYISAPIKLGEKLGSIAIFKSGELYKEYGIVSDKSVARQKEKNIFGFIN